MKKNLLFLTGLLLCGAFTTKSVAQMSAELQNCNDIKANNFNLKNDAKVEDFAYVLEKSIAPDVWMSVQKVNDEKTAANFLDLKPGTYRVKFARADERETALSTSNAVVINNCIGNGKGGSVKMLTYPNPVSDIFSVSVSGVSDTENMTIDLVNMQGKKVKTLSLDGNSATASAANLPKGVYFICLIAGDETIAREKLVIN